MRKLFASLLTLTILSLTALSPVMVFAAGAKDAVCGGAGLVNGGNGCSTSPDSPTLDSTLKKGINLFSAIIGIIAVVMMMIGGIKYITSQGDSNNTASAKNTILYAAIGLVVVAFAQIIVNFVLNKFTTL